MIFEIFALVFVREDLTSIIMLEELLNAVYLPKIAFHMTESCCYINTVTVTTGATLKAAARETFLYPFHRRGHSLSFIMDVDALLRGACGERACKASADRGPHYYTKTHTQSLLL